MFDTDVNCGEFDGICRCIKCNIDMGSNNPRQLCGKFDCDDYYIGIFHIDENYIKKYNTSSNVDKLNMLSNELHCLRESLNFFRKEVKDTTTQMQIKLLNFNKKTMEEIIEISEEFKVEDNRLSNNIFYKNLLEREYNIWCKYNNLFTQILDKMKE